MIATACGVALLWGGLAVADHHEHEKKLPPGPIHDRHELMEGIGRRAKKIGAAAKAGDKKAMVPEAEAIAAAAKKAPALFPPGSTHPESRAKPEIWKDWAKFETDMTTMQKAATNLATVAAADGDTDTATKQLFDACKACHDQFRVPED
jgi:cytochrome c556